MLYSICTNTDSTDVKIRKGEAGVFELNLRGGKGAIYQQLKAEVVRLCGMGVLLPDDQLPSVRTLARELGINPNTVAKAYSQLEADGLTYSVAGKGSFIRSEPEQLQAIRMRALDDFSESVRQARATGLKAETLIQAVEAVFSEETPAENDGERNEEE